MKVDRDALCEMIPHAGNMCLLDSVESWDEQRIICTIRSHRGTDHPLRFMNRLSAVNILEYGAQAMAVHGSLNSQEQGARIQGGYVAAIRDARFHIERLDLLQQPLTLEAIQIFSSGGNQIYRVKASSAGQPVAEARITVINSLEANG